MLSIKSRLLISALLFSILTVHPSSIAWAEDSCEEWIGKIVSVQGIVQAQKISQNYWKPVLLNDTFCAGNMIRVQKQSRAAVVLSNGATLRLDQNSTVTFSRLEKKKTLLLKLLNGAAHFFSRIPRSLKLATPFVNGGVEGTEFYVKVERKPSDHQRPISSSKKRKGTRITYGRASPGCRPMGIVLSTRHICSN
jgi:hypothetical protein